MVRLLCSFKLSLIIHKQCHISSSLLNLVIGNLIFRSIVFKVFTINKALCFITIIIESYKLQGLLFLLIIYALVYLNVSLFQKLVFTISIPNRVTSFYRKTVNSSFQD